VRAASLLTVFPREREPVGTDAHVGGMNVLMVVEIALATWTMNYVRQRVAKDMSCAGELLRA
jgi:hypothetical protein